MWLLVFPTLNLIIKMDLCVDIFPHMSRFSFPTLIHILKMDLCVAIFPHISRFIFPTLIHMSTYLIFWIHLKKCVHSFTAILKLCLIYFDSMTQIVGISNGILNHYILYFILTYSWSAMNIWFFPPYQCYIREVSPGLKK